MKYEVTFSCGHTATIELFGKGSERERKIKYFEEQGICPDCYREKQEKEKSKNADAVRIKYAEYKKNYSFCKTQRDSYDSKDKTIVVYIPNVETIISNVFADIDRVGSDYSPAAVNAIKNEFVKFCDGNPIETIINTVPRIDDGYIRGSLNSAERFVKGEK